MHVSSTFWTVTKPLLIADRATIPHFNQDIQGFHMTPNAQMFLVKLPCYRLIIPLNIFPLVQSPKIWLVRGLVKSVPAVG